MIRRVTAAVTTIRRAAVRVWIFPDAAEAAAVDWCVSQRGDTHRPLRGKAAPCNLFCRTSERIKPARSAREFNLLSRACLAIFPFYRNERIRSFASLRPPHFA
jgi:hypothetical protein